VENIASGQNTGGYGTQPAIAVRAVSELPKQKEYEKTTTLTLAMSILWAVNGFMA
jgi:hypothetical protein